MESLDPGAFVVKPQQVIDDKFVKIHKEEGFSPKRDPVLIFPLLVTDGIFYNPDHELCVFRVKIITAAFVILQESLAGFDPVLIGYPLSGYAVPCVIENGVPVLELTHSSSPMLYPGHWSASAPGPLL